MGGGLGKDEQTEENHEKERAKMITKTEHTVRSPGLDPWAVGVGNRGEMVGSKTVKIS